MASKRFFDEFENSSSNFSIFEKLKSILEKHFIKKNIELVAINFLAAHSCRLQMCKNSPKRYILINLLTPRNENFASHPKAYLKALL
jgi:hypothetical protein